MDRKRVDETKIYDEVLKQSLNDSGRQDSLIDIPPDVYRLIRSAEIRDYFRKNDCMGIFMKEQIILHSYTSMQQKTEMLKRLSHTGSEEENRLVEEMYRIYRKYTDLIFHPPVRTIFLLEYCPEGWEDGNPGCDRILDGVFDDVDGLIDCLASYEINGLTGRKEMIDYHGEVSVVQVPHDAKLEQPFSFTVHWIDGKWQIKSIRVDDEELMHHGFSKDTIYRFKDLGNYFPLPFEDGSRLKVQMPFMKEPFYGVIWSEKDGNGCWYHWLNFNGEEGDCVNLTYMEFGLCSGYSTLDWVERA